MSDMFEGFSKYISEVKALKEENEELKEEVEFLNQSRVYKDEVIFDFRLKIDVLDKDCRLYQSRCDKLSNENSQLRHQLKEKSKR